jgi:hypothetical protein
MFYRIKPDIYARSGILEEPRIPGFTETFITGAKLASAPPVPLAFRSNFDKDDPPRGFEGMTIPLWSKDFVDLLRGIGVDNFDLYAAVITGEGGETWSDYFAVNVLGAVAAADMAKSRFLEIVATPGGAPLTGFQDLVIDPSKVATLDMFRLFESPSTLIVSDRVTAALASNPRQGGWGITAFPIEEARINP